MWSRCDEEGCIEETILLGKYLFQQKQIPHHVDIWGQESRHTQLVGMTSQNVFGHFYEPKKTSMYHIRPATPSDAQSIYELIVALAIYEKETTSR